MAIINVNSYLTFADDICGFGRIQKLTEQAVIHCFRNLKNWNKLEKNYCINETGPISYKNDYVF